MSAGNSTFVAANFSRFEVTSVGIPGGDAISTGSAQGCFACGAAVRFDCGQSPRFTAHSQLFTQAGKAGRSRRPRQGGVSVASSTRIRHSGTELPAVGLLPQDAGQCEGRGLRLHLVGLKLRSCVRLVERGCKRRAGSLADCLTARTDTLRSDNIGDCPRVV